MGIILGPLIIFWFTMAIYSLKIGYSLLGKFQLFPSLIVIALVAIIALTSYVYVGLMRFKTKKELWWCDIPLFFTTNKIAFCIFIVAILIHWFGIGYLTYPYIRPVAFIIIFTLSFGAIAGTFISDAFMSKYNIVRTH